MLGEEILRIVDTLHRDKKIDKEILFEDIETALLTATRKKFGITDDITVHINRQTGAIEAFKGAEPIEPGTFGRIAAQTAKQVMIQRIREAERNVIYADFENRVGDLINGSVIRFEGPNIIVNLGNTEGLLPRSEQVRDEVYRPGDRIKCVILEVKKVGQKVRIILSRAHPDLVRRLFEVEVPEIAERTIEIKGLVREPGFRSKVAVSSIDNRIDAVGACVGVRGTRIKNIVDEIKGEKIDIVRWNDSVEVLISNSMRPAEIDSITLNYDEKKAVVMVPKDQLSLAIGKRGQNVRLASKLVGWELDVVMSDAPGGEGQQQPEEAIPTVEQLFGEDKSVPPPGAKKEITAATLFKTEEQLAAERAAREAAEQEKAEQ